MNQQIGKSASYVELLKDLLTSSENGLSVDMANKLVNDNPEIVRTGIMHGNQSLRAVVYALKMAGVKEGGITKLTFCKCGFRIDPVSVLYGTSAFTRCRMCGNIVDLEF